MQVLEPRAAGIIKRAIDVIYPVWRQVGSSREAETPPIIVVEIDGVPHAVATGTGADVFGAGHLGLARWWQCEGECRGVAVKSFVGGEALRRADDQQVMGFIHIHRSILANAVVARFVDEGSLIAKAVEFFAEYEGEFSAFFPVVFARVGSEDYPWRALPPP